MWKIACLVYELTLIIFHLWRIRKPTSKQKKATWEVSKLCTFQNVSLFLERHFAKRRLRHCSCVVVFILNFCFLLIRIHACNFAQVRILKALTFKNRYFHLKRFFIILREQVPLTMKPTSLRLQHDQQTVRIWATYYFQWKYSADVIYSGHNSC